jgi:hypothetical protein
MSEFQNVYVVPGRYERLGEECRQSRLGCVVIEVLSEGESWNGLNDKERIP